MKSYTDLEQSERLAKILPLESADMALCSKVQPLMTDYKKKKKSLVMQVKFRLILVGVLQHCLIFYLKNIIR